VEGHCAGRPFQGHEDHLRRPHRPRAEQELKSLERIKSVRYPFLISLERFEVVEGQLLIVTEVADCSLMNRFQECHEAGLPGIPREELIGYLHDAADALDYMNETHGLQHLDIKPENLLLLSGRIKVADFGLVKDLLGSSTRITEGVTPIYAPPEAFDGRVSRHSDQYSLAIGERNLRLRRASFDRLAAHAKLLLG
jgi:serine/threonine protein kinase